MLLVLLRYTIRPTLLAFNASFNNKTAQLESVLFAFSFREQILHVVLYPPLIQ